MEEIAITESLDDSGSLRSKLRRFGITIAVALAVLGALLFWRGKDHYIYSLILSAVFLTLGLIRPNVLAPVHKVWMMLSIVLGWFMTRIILSILFFTILTPIGVVARLFGKRFLDLEIDKPRDTYWLYREARKPQKNDYEKQF